MKRKFFFSGVALMAGSLLPLSYSAAAQSVVDSVATEQGLKRLSDALQSPPPITDIISTGKIFWTIIFIISGYIVLKIITRFFHIWAERSTKYRITIKSLIPVIRIIGWIIITYIIIAAIIQPPMATILAFSASIGVAVGFASQDILKIYSRA